MSPFFGLDARARNVAHFRARLRSLLRTKRSFSMRRSILGVVFLATSACTMPPLTPSTGPWRFSGTVSRVAGTQLGGPIAGAELTVVSGVNSNATVTTDSSGRYVFTALERDRFTVAIAAPGYLSASPVVNLDRDVEANFALKPR